MGHSQNGFFVCTGYVFFKIFIFLCMDICIVQRFDLHSRSMRYIKIDVIIKYYSDFCHSHYSSRE